MTTGKFARFAVLALLSATASAADVVVLSTVAAKSVLEQLAPAFEEASGHKVILRFATTAEMKAEIEKGAPFDMALLTTAAVDDLIKQNLIAGGSKANLARSGVGMAVRRDVAMPNLVTTDDLKQALVNAKTIAMSTQGASGPIMRRIFERFGLSDALAGKLVLVSKITTPEAVAAGQAELGFTQISEILDTAGTRLVGALPPEVQVYSSFSAGIAAAGKDSGAAKAFLDILQTDTAKTVWRAKGLEPL